MRDIPKKNYFILLIMILSVVAITIVLMNAYNNRVKKTSIMYNYLSEIKENDLDAYLIENPNIVIYIADKYDLSNNQVEKKLKKKMIKLNISDYFVFLNLNNDMDFINQLNEKYYGNVEKNLPVIVVFEDGKIKESFYDLNDTSINKIMGELK
ncbi:MAG: hypothetical protein IJR82_00760 [Bacilli bacterium]|nr:hypothetical protein [Bacilli bacterium]